MKADDVSPENLIAFLDANIVLEGKPVTDLPWEEVAADGTIKVLIVPKAMEEIDAKKRDGRLGPYARAFNRLIAPSIIQNDVVILRESGPRVELAMAVCTRIDWERFDELDPNDGDSRIVAEALHVQGVDCDRRVLISHDIKPLAYARGRDLHVHQASDAWLRPIEPGPKDKEIQRLKQQVADLKKDEPNFAILIEVSGGDPTIFYKIAPLEAQEALALIESIRSKNGKVEQPQAPFGIAGMYSDYDSSYDDNYEEYLNKTLPNFVANFNDKLEVLFNQRQLTVRVVNSGMIRADHLVVSIGTNDGWLNGSAVFVSPSGPSPPAPTPYRHQLYHGPTVQDLIAARVGRHEFELVRPARRTAEIEVSCEDFRSGQEYCFEGVIVPTSSTNTIEIKVALTASNLRGELVEIFRLEKDVVAVVPSDLIDLAELAFKQDYAIKGELERLVRSERYNDIEWDGEGDAD